MANKEKMDYLLLDIRELETLVAGMRDAEVYPASFFGQTFDITHKILNELHSLEAVQIEVLRKQMEEHQALIQSIPHSVVVPVPPTPVPEKITLEPVIEVPVVVAQVKETIVEIPEPELPVEEVVILNSAPVQPVEASHKLTVPEKPGLFLNDLLEKKNLSDFRKAFSLNDRFRFRRELFGGDEGRMNKAISDLNDISSYEDSITYLNNKLNWNIEDESVADFIRLLEKRFL